jgi:2-polyprenyl-6-methoxyphenol hydroxylase-like FAD-dependent oxidoreductase
MHEHRQADVVVVGAGIAGCIMALILGLQGRKVLVVERASEVGRVGPDFVKPRGIEILARLGLLDDLGARGALKRSVIRYYHDRELIIDYDFSRHTEVGHYIIVPYEVLLSVVLARLHALPEVELWFSADIRALTTGEHGRARIEIVDGRSATAAVVIGADGTNSAVRGHAGIVATREPYDQIMYFATLPLVPSVERCNRLYMTSARWAAYFYPVSAERMRISGVMPAAERPIFTGDPSRLVTHLRRFVSESDDVLDAIHDTAAFALIPLGRMHAGAYHRGNVVLIGNALIEIHPMTGQGMSLAMEDADALGRHLRVYFAGETDLDAALAAYADERRAVHQQLLDYGDRLHRSFPVRAAYLANFDPQAHGSMQRRAP